MGSTIFQFFSTSVDCRWDLSPSPSSKCIRKMQIYELIYNMNVRRSRWGGWNSLISKAERLRVMRMEAILSFNKQQGWHSTFPKVV